MLRKYEQKQDNFIRIQFCDEHLEKGFYSNEFNKPMTEHIKDVIIKGIKICGKSFRYIG